MMVTIDNPFLLGIIVLLIGIICKYLVYDPLISLKNAIDVLLEFMHSQKTFVEQQAKKNKKFDEATEDINKSISLMKNVTRELRKNVDEVKKQVDSSERKIRLLFIKYKNHNHKGENNV